MPPYHEDSYSGRYSGRTILHQHHHDHGRRDRDRDRDERYGRRDGYDDRYRRSRSRRRRSASRDDPHARILASTLCRLARRQSDAQDDRGVQLVMNFGALQLQDQSGLVRDPGLYAAGDALGDTVVGRRRYYSGGLTGVGTGVRALDLALPSWGPGVSGLLEPGSGLGRYGYSGAGGLLTGDALGYGGIGERYSQQDYRPLGEISGLGAYDGLRRGGGPGLGAHGMGMVSACRQCGVRRAAIGYGGTCRECVFENGLRERERERERERDRERLLDRTEGRGLLLGYGPTRRAIGYGRA